MSDEASMAAKYMHEYKEVCSNFRLLTEIRFKLLALLPIGTGVGVAFARNEQVGTSLLGLFGLLVTSSAALYNMRNDQLYNELVARAAQIERVLSLKEGAFAQRPRPWLRLGPFEVNHAKIWWIYLGSLAAWVYTILIGFNGLAPIDWPPILINLAEITVAVLLVLIVARIVSWQKNKTRAQLKIAARNAIKLLLEPTSLDSMDRSSWASFLKEAAVLGETKPEMLDSALQFYLADWTGIYWNRPALGQPCDHRAAAQLLSLISDMPARWIFDISSERRA